METNKILEEYKILGMALSIEEEKELFYKYVYATNKLEGNKLTLSQTTQLLSSDTITGNNIRTSDILEQKGMYKALMRMLKAIREKEALSIELLLELNWLSIGNLWKDDNYYVDAKLKGQTEGTFKISQNQIRITKGGKVLLHQDSLSNPNNAKENTQNIIDTVLKSDKPIIEKAAFLAQEIWLHQPFVDGNKRTGRLLINFLTMIEGFPLFVFEDNSINYNALLVEQYLEKKPGLVMNYIDKRLQSTMKNYIKNYKKPNKGNGFRMFL
jgi:Fic family protein